MKVGKARTQTTLVFVLVVTIAGNFLQLQHMKVSFSPWSPRGCYRIAQDSWWRKSQHVVGKSNALHFRALRGEHKIQSDEFPFHAEWE